MLTIIDEYTRECLAIDIGRKLTKEDVLDRLTSLFVCSGLPEHIRSDTDQNLQLKQFVHGFNVLELRHYILSLETRGKTAT